MFDQNKVYVSAFALQTALRTASQDQIEHLYENNTKLIDKNPELKAEFDEAMKVGGDVNELRERHKDRVPTYSEGSEGATVYPSYGQLKKY